MVMDRVLVVGVVGHNVWSLRSVQLSVTSRALRHSWRCFSPSSLLWNLMTRFGKKNMRSLWLSWRKYNTFNAMFVYELWFSDVGKIF